MKAIPCAVFCSLAIILCLPALAQRTDINRYTLFTGFDYLISPARNLTERGFEGDFGVTVKPWLGLGGDFSAIGDSVISGAGTINGSETVYAGAINQSGLVPGGASSINVPFRSTTYTFAAGPQFYFRKWDRVTFFARPGLGGIHEVANITFPLGLGTLFDVLNIPVPSSHQTDTQLFVGLGGGFDINITRPLGWRFATDYVNTHLFSNILASRQNYWRFSTGPTFRWGHLK
ncbi:MAG: outer membrane beta-barrel protein [Terriglobales bacterium]